MKLELRWYKKYEWYEKVELMWESPKGCERFKVSMEFLRECMNEWEEVEDEQIWRFF